MMPGLAVSTRPRRICQTLVIACGYVVHLGRRGACRSGARPARPGACPGRARHRQEQPAGRRRGRCDPPVLIRNRFCCLPVRAGFGHAGAQHVDDGVAAIAARIPAGPRSASRWCAPCTATRTRCCGGPPSAPAMRRRGWSPAPNRTPSSGNCWPATSRMGRMPPRRGRRICGPRCSTAGFATELRNLLARCAERGVDPQELERLGRRCGDRNGRPPVNSRGSTSR